MFIMIRMPNHVCTSGFARVVINIWRRVLSRGLHVMLLTFFLRWFQASAQRFLHGVWQGWFFVCILAPRGLGGRSLRRPAGLWGISEGFPYWLVSVLARFFTELEKMLYDVTGALCLRSSVRTSWFFCGAWRLYIRVLWQCLCCTDFRRM